MPGVLLLKAKYQKSKKIITIFLNTLLEIFSDFWKTERKEEDKMCHFQQNMQGMAFSTVDQKFSCVLFIVEAR